VRSDEKYPSHPTLGLIVNPSKTELALFTNKYKPLTMWRDTQIKRTREVFNP